MWETQRESVVLGPTLDSGVQRLGVRGPLCHVSRGRGKGRRGTRDGRACTDGSLGVLGGSRVTRGAWERGTGRVDTELARARRCFE